MGFRSKGPNHIRVGFNCKLSNRPDYLFLCLTLRAAQPVLRGQIYIQSLIFQFLAKECPGPMLKSK